VKKEFSWSYSALENYRNCPKKYYHLAVAKDVKDEDSTFAAEGRDIHVALYNRVVKGQKLPLNLRYLERVATRFVGLPGETSGELKFAMSRRFEATEYFAPTVFVRVVVDLLNVQNDEALIVDWKTGKVKPGFEQLEICAGVLSSHLPEINRFKLAYVWLKGPEITSKVITKADLPGVWNAVLPQVAKIEEAKLTTNFPARPSPLCAYCPVRSCPHNTKDD
jgi:hypothetical protein